MDTLFYDGTCGLCHRAVRLVLRRDRGGELFRFAPLGGPTFLSRVAPAERAELSDSLVLQTGAGAILMRSNAVIHILRRIGGPWKVLAALLAAIPASLRDAAYDVIARSRFAVFGRTANACPLLPPDQLTRFDP